MNEGGLSVSKPISAWNQPLEADFRSLFRALSKAVVDGAVGKWEQLASDASDALVAIGFETDAGQTAWLLIRRALTRAMFALVEEQADLLFRGEHDTDTLCESLDLSLEKTELTIDAGFFERPRELPVLEAMRAPFAEWLIGAGRASGATVGVCQPARHGMSGVAFLVKSTT